MSDAPGRSPGRGPVLVVGGGAVGSFIACVLAFGGEEVHVLDRPGMPVGPDNVRLVTPDGRDLRIRVIRADDPGACPAPDFAVFAVRMTELAAALPVMERWPGVPVVTLENGLGAEEMAQASLPGRAVIGGSLVAPVERLADGGPAGFAWRKRRGLALGGVRGDPVPVIARFRAAAGAIGLPFAEAADWRAMKWSKLLSNLFGNATCAILGWEPPRVLADPRLFAVERDQMREALAVMRAARIPVIALPGGDVRLLALGFRIPAWLGRPILRQVVAGARGGKLPSLALHINAGGGPTEAPWLNGGVARAAAAAGVAAPVNTTLEALVEATATDPAERAAFAGLPDAMLARINHARITGTTKGTTR